MHIKSYDSLGRYQSSNMALKNIVLFATLLATGYAELADFSNCSDEGTPGICSIREVRITPCKNPSNCVLKKGSDATMSFDFTPNFVTDKLTTTVYWDNGKIDLPFEDFGSTDACAYTPCPTVAGKEQTLNYNLHVGKKLPQGLFHLKWKVWNDANREQVCCFRTTISLKNSNKMT